MSDDGCPGDVGRYAFGVEGDLLSFTLTDDPLRAGRRPDDVELDPGGVAAGRAPTARGVTRPDAAAPIGAVPWPAEAIHGVRVVAAGLFVAGRDPEPSSWEKMPPQQAVAR